jgi:hypothetical protein
MITTFCSAVSKVMHGRESRRVSSDGCRDLSAFIYCCGGRSLIGSCRTGVAASSRVRTGHVHPGLSPKRRIALVAALTAIGMAAVARSAQFGALGPK